MKNKNKKIKFLKIVQYFFLFFFFTAPFIKTPNGNSLVRFDVDSLNLYFFNQIINFKNFLNISLTLLIFVFVFIVVAQIFGRVWCGWLCPHSVFNDIIARLNSRFNKKIADLFFAAFFSFIFSITLVFYFVSPYDIFHVLFIERSLLTIFFLSSLFIICFIDFAFIKYKWCKYVCPYSKLQSLMGDDETLYIGMLKGKELDCIKCRACVRVCPMGIDPRRNPNMDCIYCEKCIDACARMMEHRSSFSILGYLWGKSGKFALLRINLIVTIAIVLFLSSILFYNLFLNNPFYLKIEDIKTKADNIELRILVENNERLPSIIHFDILPEGSASIEPEKISFMTKGSQVIIFKIIKNDTFAGDDIYLKAINSSGYLKEIKLGKLL